ncbi:MAG: gamma-glutamyltransferase [Pseudomonadota bacterium]
MSVGVTEQSAKGAIACGHPETAAAAREILEDGGNAFDAILAGFVAATVAEPVFCSLGGGGFLLAGPAEGAPLLYDFFVQTPLKRRASEEIDFYPSHADFGTVKQEFHIGLGAMATPGAIKGLFAVHQDLASLPMSRLVEPAVRVAREGFVLREIDAFVLGVVGAILVARDDSKAVYTNADGSLLSAGQTMVQRDLAETIEALAAEGEGYLHDGPLGEKLIVACRQQGGWLTEHDLSDYRVARRRPLTRDYRGARILTNPPPSSGGILIAFALAMLAEQDFADVRFGSAAHLDLLAQVMATTNRARVENHLQDALDDQRDGAAEQLLDPDLLARYAAQVRGHPMNPRGTTHLSVIDRAGNMAALTLSNGEGCGYVLPGSGIMMNNMLGEEDLNPRGFHQWPENHRISSMMAPSLAHIADGRSVALGSGGSNRIRTAILQVLVNLIDHGQTIDQAVENPRLHFERGVANLEKGFEAGAAASLEGLAERVIAWPSQNLYFGGVHGVTRHKDGRFAAAGDLRRGGVAEIV